MDCHRAIKAVMKPRSPASLDIRAPRRLRLKDMLSWPMQRSLMLMLADITALALSWKIARWLNQYFSPVPEQLVWWKWLSIPSPLWIMGGMTLLLFTYAGLYGAQHQIKNYLQAGKLVSLVYLASLVLMYFYDPKLDLPRSLFFSAWLSSVVKASAMASGPSWMSSSMSWSSVVEFWLAFRGWVICGLLEG